MKKLYPLLLSSFLLLFALNTSGQTSIPTLGSAVTEAFTGYAGTSTLPTNWTTSATGTNGNTFQGNNQVGGTSGGWYGNNNMSYLGSGTATLGNATWRLRNNTGSTINSFDISFVARMWKSGSNSPSVSLTYSTNSTGTVPAAGALTSILTFSDATANISTGTTLSQTISSISIPNGDYLYIRFIHAGNTSSDNIGWDDVSITPYTANTITTTSASYGPFCNASSNNISVAFSSTGSFSGNFFVQISDASGTFPSNSTSNLISSGSATSPITATIPAAQAAGTGYRVRVVNPTPAIQGSNNLNNITITGASTPSVTIASSDADNSICPGDNVTFTPSPTNGGAGPTYNWWKNGIGTGTNLGTSATYSTTGLANNDAIACVMTSNASCVSPATANSNSISTAVISCSTTITTTGASYGPFCNASGNNISVAYTPSGSFSGTFSVQLSDASGTFPNNTTGNLIGSGASPITATIPAAQAAGTGYRVRVINNNPVTYGTDNGSNITITAAVAPSVSIASSDADNSICAGTNVTFTPTPTNGGAGPTYQWWKNGIGTGTNLGTSATYSSTSLANNDAIACVITSNAACISPATANSNSISTTVISLVTPSVSIASSDADNIICAGTNVTFTPTPTNGGAGPTYQWWKNGIGTGTNLGTSATYSSSALANGDAIACVMTSNATCPSPTTANSNSIATTVNALPNTPTNPTAAANPACTSTTLNTMTPTAGETWYWQGTTNNNQSTGNGTTASTYTASVAGANTYYVQARNNSSLCWSAASGSVSVTVNTAIAIGTPPADQTVSTPATATFNVSGITGTVSGYQWQLNTGSGWNDISGETSASYTTGATNTGMSGNQYRCIVKGTSPCSDATSSAATLTVNLAASVIAEFDFTSNPYLTYTLKDANVTVTDVALSAGTIETNITTGTVFPNEPYIEETGGWTTTAQAGAKNFNFTINAVSGYEIQVTSMEFRALATSAGPSAFSYNIGSGLATYTTNAPDGTLVYVNQAVSGVTGQTALPVLIQGWLNSSRTTTGTGAFRIDDIIVKGYVTPVCSIPASQASSVTTSSISPTGLNAGFTRGSSNGTVLVIKPTAQTTVLPSQNTSYTANVDWTSAGQINTDNRVIANSTAATTSTVSVNSITNLTPETQYTLTAYERSSTNCYNLTAAPTATFYTLSTEPTAHSSSGLSSSTCTANSIDLTIPAPDWGADGFLVIYKSGGGTPSGLPTDAQSYSVGNTFGDATVGAIVTSASTITISGLSASTSYTFKLIPYNANSTGTAQTYNYLTTGSIYTTATTTLATSASTASLVTTDASYTYTQNIDYTAYQSTTVPSLAGQSVGVFNFIINDGNGSSNDADGLSTILNGISFTYTGNAGSIRAAALFTTTNSKVADATSVGASSITFSGLTGSNVTTADNNVGGAKQLILRVTFTTNVIDHDKLVFTVSSVTGGDACTYSQFNGASGGGAFSDNGANNKNKIEVTATKLTFSTVNNSSVSVDLSTFTITAQDNNNIKDLDAAGSITLDCPDDSPNGSMTAGSYSLTAGTVTISSGINFNAVQTGIHLTASIASPSINGSSNAFDIYLSSFSGGAWLSKTGSGGYTSTGSWCKCPNPGPCTGMTPGSGGWGALGTSGSTPGSSSSVYIQGTITLSGGSLGVTNSTILSGGNLIVNSQHPISSSMTVKSGGTLTINDDLNFNSSSATFEVEDSGTVIIDYYWNNDPTPPIWSGIENFHPQSNLIIKNWDSRIYLADNNVTSNTYNGKSAMFGNIYVNPGQDPNTNNGPYNLGIARQNWELIGPNNTSPVNFTHGTIEFQKAPYNTFSDNYQNIRFMGNPNSNTYDVSVHGSIKLSGTSGAVYGATKGNFTLNVDSNVVMSTGSFSVRAAQTATGHTTMNVAGNITMSGTSSLFLNQNQYPTPNAVIKKSILNLKGNLTVASTASILSGCPYTESEFNFNGTTGTQSVNVASTLAGTSSTYLGIPFTVKNGASVQLSTNNLIINNGSSITIEDGATFDFGFNGSTALYVSQPASPLGSNLFTSAQKSTLKITSPEGLYDEWDRAAYTAAGVTINTGNLQSLPKSNRSFSPLATFWYIGKGNQKTGDAPNASLSSTADGKVVICDLQDKSYTLTQTVSFGVSKDVTVSTTGGKLDIRRGQFIETETAYIFGSTGTLYMAQGTLYKIVKGNSTAAASNADLIPRMDGASTSNPNNPYILTGGTIELGGSTSGNYFQTLRGTLGGRPDYKYIKYSGANAYDNATHTATDYKNLSSTTTVDSALIITGTAIVDCINGAGTATSFDSSGNGGLIMDGGRLRLKNVSYTQPELPGTNVAYALTGGTVEMYGSSATQQQQLRGNYRPASPLKVTYYDIDINAAASNYDTTVATGASNAGNVDMNSSFLLKHALNVYSPAVFRMDQTDFIDDAVSPSNSITINTGAGLLYGNQYGIKSSGTGINDGNIRISGTRTLSTSASYGFVGPNDMESGSGLPATVANLYVYKSSVQKLITLTNSVSISNTFNFYRGIVTTGNNAVSVLNGSKTAITGHDAPFTAGTGTPAYSDDKYVIGNLERNINTTGIYVYPIGDVVSGEGYNPLRFDVATGSGKATCKFIAGDPGIITAGPVFFDCGGTQKGYLYTDMTSEGKWNMTSSTGTTFTYDVYLHPNFKNANTNPNVMIDNNGTNYLIDYRSLKAPTGTTDWSAYAGTGDVCVSSYYYNIQGKGFSGFSDFAPAGGNTNTTEQLPVELMSFSGNCNEDGTTQLNWSTASEQNSKHYVVEHSTDGTHFSSIATIAAAGNSHEIKNYFANDNTVLSDRMYYRLIMVDLDNTFTISNTIIVNCDNSGNGFSFYYTPADGIVIKSQTDAGNKYTISLFDVTGKLLLSESKQIDKGFSKFNLDVRKKLADGIYFIRASNGTNSYAQKLWIH